MKTSIQRSIQNSVAAAALVVLATTAASVAFADDHGKMGKGKMGEHGQMHNMTPEMAEKFAERRVERLAKAVNATPEQKAKLLAIGKDSAKQAQAQHSKMTEMHTKEKALLSSAKLDRAAIEKLNTEKAAQHDAMRKIREKAQLDSLEVLTPEQRVKLSEKMGKNMDKRMGKDGKGNKMQHGG